jgi:hypothetical protein
MGKTACVDLYEGVGNIIQLVPFVMALRGRYDEVWAYQRAIDYPQVWEVVGHLFDGMIPSGTPITGDYFPCPRLTSGGSRSEWRQWFEVYGVPVPEPITFDVKCAPPPLGVGHLLMDGCDVVLWPGCKPNWKSKRWPHWATLAERFDHPVIVGLAGEGGAFPDHCLDLRGDLTLAATGGVLQQAPLYLGNEGGLSHYANALGAPAVGIVYGGTDPVKNMPPARKGLLRIALCLECQPCQFRVPGRQAQAGCPGLPCLEQLTADAVYDEAMGLLEAIS